MVHTRLNEQESNPNPHVNFISPLRTRNPASQEDARQFLRALAAQVRPIMKAHGFVVNSLEEYEYNMVFAGRNWNNGETLVLRRPNGSFLPTSWLMGTLCHELAHIKHMNHGPAFHALWKQLRDEVRALQDKGYYGDGYWSSGARLFDSAKVSGDGIEAGEFPEYMCGGAQSRTRPTALRRRRRSPQKRPGEPIASHKTGRQTAKKRKAGARVTSQYAFTGEGASLVEGLDVKGKGSGKRAREERALAAERRIQALTKSQQASTSKASHDNSSSDSEEDGLSDDEPLGETDAERRKALLQSETADDMQKLGGGSSWRDFEDDFIFTGQQREKSPRAIIDISSDDDIPVASGSTFTKDHTSSSLGKMVENEISLRKKESLGMAPLKAGGRILGGAARSTQTEPKRTPEWACTFCTLCVCISYICVIGTEPSSRLNRGAICEACMQPRVHT
ncbi:WLM domain-containing protein [Mycena rosella]|uniref:WLM domain-containing protein n=1 Tax=Mycena rosella TaxID=1033263 RepID=A0AAD7GY29_MYCRO|nr:WLM domain-containing protein [Mycena rosella]